MEKRKRKKRGEARRTQTTGKKSVLINWIEIVCLLLFADIIEMGKDSG